MFNPRFPHTLTVLRAKEVNGEIVYDSDGNPTYETVSLALVTTIDGEPCRNADGSFQTTSVTSMPFGYRTSSQNTREGEVIVADFKLACPMFVTELKDGDRLELKDYDRTYLCSFVKKTTFNWGTNIWVNDIRN